jgi:microcompartment protein CcmL/EutN
VASQVRAIGVIEGRLLLPLINISNAMRKVADVSLHHLQPIGGGITLAVISGEVGAVRVALETADAAAVEYEDSTRTQVFAHPGPEVWELFENLGVNVDLTQSL